MGENDWHGYFLVERHTVGAGNWAALLALFEAMGTTDSPYPAHNNHWRARPDGDAVIFESRFNPTEVSIPSFKQLLADEFEIDVADIAHATSHTSYSGDEQSTIWTFAYLGVDRFSVHRFAGGGTWQQSRHEALAYLKANIGEWEGEE